MFYKQFKNSLYEQLMGSEIKTQIPLYNSMITETYDNSVYINNQLTDFTSCNEAKEFLKNKIFEKTYINNIQNQLYEEIPYNKISDIIKEHNQNAKITDTLIESYIDLARSKTFTLDPIVYEITKINKFDKILEDRIDFKLKDDTHVVIKEETYQRINNIFKNDSDVINFMNSNIKNFLFVVNQIEE